MAAPPASSWHHKAAAHTRGQHSGQVRFSLPGKGSHQFRIYTRWFAVMPVHKLILLLQQIFKILPMNKLLILFLIHFETYLDPRLLGKVRPVNEFLLEENRFHIFCEFGTQSPLWASTCYSGLKRKKLIPDRIKCCLFLNSLYRNGHNLQIFYTPVGGCLHLIGCLTLGTNTFQLCHWHWCHWHDGVDVTLRVVIFFLPQLPSQCHSLPPLITTGTFASPDVKLRAKV